MPKPWIIDELATAGSEHLDAEFVEGYDRKQGYPDPMSDFEEFATNGIGPGSTIVDIGAGTGQFSLAAAPRFHRLVAIDISPEMVRLLRERATAAGLSN